MVESRTASTTRAISFLYTLDMARLAPYLVFVVSLAVYLATLAPTVYRLDSAESSAAAYNLGVPHATGYPFTCSWVKHLPICPSAMSATDLI